MAVYDYQYYIRGRQIALLQRQLDNIYDPYLMSEDLVYQTPENDDVVAIRIECTIKPTAPSDETSTIDLPEMLMKAAEDFVKSRIAEDALNFAVADRYMKEFYKKIEVHRQNLSGGYPIIMPSGIGVIK